MKKGLLLLSAIMISSVLIAQTVKEEVDLFQAVFGMEKKALVADFVTPSPVQADAFWTLYDQYEAQRKNLGKERMDLLYYYALKYATLTNEEANQWTLKLIALQRKTDALLNTYYKKMKKVTNGIVATQFYQIELFILTQIRMEILDTVPFIEEKPE